MKKILSILAILVSIALLPTSCGKGDEIEQEETNNSGQPSNPDNPDNPSDPDNPDNPDSPKPFEFKDGMFYCDNVLGYDWNGDANPEKYEVLITAYSDAEDPNKIWFENFDPLYGPDDNNKVYGTLNREERIISIPSGQHLGDCHIEGITSNLERSESINVSIIYEGEALVFENAWEIWGEDDDSKDIVYERYTPGIIISRILPTTGVSISKTSLTLEEGETALLEAIVLPENATIRKVYWKSENDKIALVDDGYVIALKPGETDISVFTSQGDYTAKCHVIVEKKKIPVEDIVMRPTVAYIPISKTFTLEADVIPEEASDPSLEWTSSNSSVVSVEQGVITGKKQGNAVITATTTNGKKATCEVYVLPQNQIIEFTFTNYTNYGEGFEPALVIQDGFGGKYIGKAIDIIQDKGYLAFDAPVTSIPDGSFNAINESTAIASFTNWWYLESMTLPETVVSIGDKAFYNCTSLKELICGEELQRIGNYAFWQCKELQSPFVYPKLTYIGDSAFEKCTKMSEIVIPQGVAYVGKSALFCMVDTITINNLTGAQTGAFTGCRANEAIINCDVSGEFKQTYIKIVHFGDNVSIIGKESFSMADTEEVYLGNEVTTIGNSAFSNCDKLNSIHFNNKLKIIEGSAFYGCDLLQEVILPDSVETIGLNAFMYCTNLRIITFGTSTKEIGMFAVAYTPIETIYCRALTPPTIVNLGLDLDNSLVIYVPKASIDAYKSSWSTYKKYLQAYSF